MRLLAIPSGVLSKKELAFADSRTANSARREKTRQAIALGVYAAACVRCVWTHRVAAVYKQFTKFVGPRVTSYRNYRCRARVDTSLVTAIPVGE